MMNDEIRNMNNKFAGRSNS